MNPGGRRGVMTLGALGDPGDGDGRQGGGLARPGGDGWQGAVAVAGKRARALYARCRGVGWTERDFQFPAFTAPLAAGAETETAATIQVTSIRCGWVRLVAMTGCLTWTNGASATPVTTYQLDMANLGLRLQLNAENDLTTTGQSSAYVPFASLFGSNGAAGPSWYWFEAPPRLKTSDTVALYLQNQYSLSNPGTTELLGAVTLRMVDDDWWTAVMLGCEPSDCA